MAVTITKPASGATLTGLATVEATFTGQNFEIAAVTVDGQQLASDSGKPIAFSIDTTQVPDGLHTLTVAVRYRTSGGARRWQKASIPITTEGNDMEVTISTNKDTSNLAGTVVVTATVTPSAQATTPVSCQFFVDNVLKATDTSYPLSFSWDTTLVADGDHVLKATVVAKRTKTKTLPVKVKNVATPPPPPPVQGVPVNTAAPTISGTATEGQTLTISNGTWTNTPTSYSRQWMRCDAAGANGVPIPSASGGTYSLAAADVGSTIRCWTTAFISGVGSSASILSAQTAVVSALAPSVPVLVVAPMITGVPNPGNTLIISDGGWTNSPTSYTHCWNRCDAAGGNCAEILDIAQNCGTHLNDVYVLTSADVGKTIKCYTTAYNATGASTPHLTAATAVVTTPPPPPPVSSYNIPRWLVTLPASGGIIARWRLYETAANSVVEGKPHLATPASVRATGPESWEWWLCGSTLIPVGFPVNTRNFATINPHNTQYDVGNTGAGGVGWGFGSGVSAFHIFYDSVHNQFYLYHDPAGSTEWVLVPSVARGQRYDFVVQLILGRTDGQLGLAGAGVSGGGIGSHPNGGNGKTKVWVNGVLVADTGNINTLQRATNSGDGKTYTQTLLYRPWDGAYVVPSLSAQITMERTVTRVGRTLAEALADNGFQLDSEWESGSTTNLTPLLSSQFIAPSLP